MREALTVRELVFETDLGLELVAENGLDRVVRGIHLSDLEDPTPFMTPGMVLLTTGEAFATAPAGGVRLLDRLATFEGAALGVGVGHYFDHVDPLIIEHARALRLPIFEAPLSVPFRTITSYVYNALASADMHRLRRSLAVQAHLLDLMIEQRGADQLVAALAAILEADVILFDSAGSVIARGGAVRQRREREVWDLLWHAEGEAGPLGILEDGTNRVYVRRVVVHGVLERALTATIPSSAPVEFVDTALSFAQRLLVLERLQEVEQLIVRRRMRSLLLDDFLAERGFREDYLPRLREQGITLDGAWRIAIFAIEGLKREVASRRPSEERIYEIKSTSLATLDRFFEQQGLSSLSSVKGDSVVSLIVVGDREPHEVATLLLAARDVVEERLSTLRTEIGCSGPAIGLKDGGRHYGDAMEALKMAKEGVGTKARLVMFDEAGGRFRLVEGQSLEALRALHRRLIAPLEEYDSRHQAALVTTLRTYVDKCMLPSQTAEALFIHRSTLRKRLCRIEAVLGVMFTRIDDVVELHLALRAAELLRAHDED